MEEIENGKRRAIGVAIDYSATSKSALKWAANNLVSHGDQLILIHIESPNSNTPKKLLFQHTGSRTQSLISLKIQIFPNSCFFFFFF